MAARRRTPGRPDVPNLRVRVKGDNVYYSWLDPKDGIDKSLEAKNNEALAVRRAKILNAQRAQEMGDQLIKRLSSGGRKEPTLSKWIPEYLRLLKEERHPAENTLRARRSHCKAWVDRLGGRTLTEISATDAKAVLMEYVNRGQARTAQSLRSALVDVYRSARQEGIIRPDAANIGEVLRIPKAKVQRARLTLDHFNVIISYAMRGEPWIRNAFYLGLATGQRVSDISLMRFRKGQDWHGKWIAWQNAQTSGERIPVDRHPYPFIENDVMHIITLKTGALIQIPLDIRLDALGLSLGDVVSRCRSKVAARTLLHHSKNRSTCNRGDPVHQNTISRRFKRARDLSGLSWPGQTPPTFHELRSLSERLYAAQGIDTQILLGHKDRRMTQVYDDPRGAEWGIVKL